MIEIRGLRKTYRMGETDVHALRGVDLKIEDGDFVAIMGPSGSGKSTLAHILGLLDVPTDGSYRLNGMEVSKLSEDALALLRRDAVGFIFQQFNLLPRMSARENVMLPLLYSKKSEGIARAQALLERVGLSARAGHRPNELSGGQQQRVAIARALINQPRMVLADEPTGNLDSISEKEVMGALRELNRQGITVIIVTHEEEIGAQASRLIRMRDGEVQSDERRTPGLALPAEPRSSANGNRAPSMAAPRFAFREVGEHFRQGYKTLAANKIRTGLSMLGILIGVAAVVSMLALGSGAKSAIENQLSALGSNLLILRPGSVKVGGVAQESGATTRLTLEDAAALKERISTIKDVSAGVTGRAQLTYLNKNWSTQVRGTAPAYSRMHAAEAKVGRFFTEEDGQKRARVAVIGTTVLRELFGTQSPIGERIKINRVSFQVIGILPEKGASGWTDQDDTVIIPVQTAMHRLLGKTFVDSIEIEVVDALAIDSTQEAIQELMNTRKKIPLSQQEGSFQIFNMADLQAALSKSSATMSTLLAAIAAISLLVGGIGIMNIMLVSVTERTKEIGLRKAIGARKQDILLQFLVESVVVSVIGGVIGILLGTTTSLVLSAVTGWTTTVSPESVFVSFFFSALIGIVFGIYPARKASQLHPIDALRYE